MSTAYRTAEDRLEIPKGNVRGHSVVNKFGSNIQSADGTREDVWDVGGTYPFPTTADITHVSQSADQATLRGGTIEIQGLDTNWDLVVQTKDLDASDSSTLVELDTPLRRVFRMKVLENVIGTENVVATNSAGTTTYSQITAGNNQTLMAIWSCPRNHTAYITNYYYSYTRDAVKDPDSVEFGLWVADRENGYEFQLKHEKGIPKQAASPQHNFNPYFKVNAKNDIKLTALADGAAAHVHGGFDIILVKNG